MKKYLHLFRTILIVLVIQGNCYAEVIFENNFDSLEKWEPTSPSECTEGDCSNKVPIGWSYYRSMGVFNPNTTPAGRNTINISNEHFRGLNGKGFTVWAESATEWSSDGILIAELGGEYNELYVSFYIQFSQNWSWTSKTDGLMKIFRMLHYDGTGNIFSYFSTGNSAPICLWDVKQSLNWGWRHYTSIRCDPQETNYYCSQNYDWDTLFPSSPSFKESLGDGNWHRIEFYAKLNSKSSSGTWNSDGIIRVWIDGILNGEKTNIQWLSENTNWQGWNVVGIGGNQHNVFTDTTSGDEQWYAIDDIIISTTPIIETSQSKSIQIINVDL